MWEGGVGDSVEVIFFSQTFGVGNCFPLDITV